MLPWSPSAWHAAYFSLYSGRCGVHLTPGLLLLCFLSHVHTAQGTAQLLGSCPYTRPSLFPPLGLHGDPARSVVSHPPTLTPGSHGPSFSSACSSVSSLQHGLVSLGTMCLCHRQQCPFISGTLAVVHPGTAHKGCFVPHVSSLLCHVGAADPGSCP